MSKTEELFKEAGVIRLEKTVLQIVGQEDILVTLDTDTFDLFSLRSFNIKMASTQIIE